MTHNQSSLIAWSAFGLAVVLALGGVAAASSDLSSAAERGSIAFTVPSFAFCAVGALVASRLPRNPVGWLILAFGMSGVLGLSAGEYARLGLVEQPGFVVGIPGAINPIGNADIAERVAPVLAVTSVLLPVVFLLCAASLVVRFRRTHGDERQQVKWFAFAAGMIVVSLWLREGETSRG